MRDRHQQPRDADFEIAAAEGRGPLWVELSVNPLGHNLLQGLLTDITDRKRAEASARELAVLQIDLDRFKSVNDTHGHEAGDRVLREVGVILEHAVRRSDVVARLGGDEFVVVLPGIESIEKAKDIATSIIAGVSQPIAIGPALRAEIGASIGVSFAQWPGESGASLLRRADAAMYAAKQAGRGRVCLARLPDDDPPASAAA